MPKRPPLYGRILLDIDDPTNRQMKKTMDRYFKSGELFLPAEDTGTCGGCGRELRKLVLAEYFGEVFCFQCVEKWTKGSQ